MHSAAYAMHGEGPMELDVAARCWDVDILFWVEWVLVLLPDVDGDGLPCSQGFPTFNACPGGRRPLHLIATDNADDDGDDGLSDLSDDDNARPRPLKSERDVAHKQLKTALLNSISFAANTPSASSL